MRKIAAVATAVAVLGAGVIGYSLIRTSGQIGRSMEMPVPLDAATRVQEPVATEPRSAPVASAAPAADAAEGSGEPRAGELTADERSPFGHVTDAPVQPDQETTIAAGPPTDAAGDTTSLAPLLTDAHATLTQLLADADGDPEATAEIAALRGSIGAPLEALLQDPDPAVREEAAKLLEALASTTAQ